MSWTKESLNFTSVPLLLETLSHFHGDCSRRTGWGMVLCLTSTLCKPHKIVFGVWEAMRSPGGGDCSSSRWSSQGAVLEVVSPAPFPLPLILTSHSCYVPLVAVVGMHCGTPLRRADSAFWQMGSKSQTHACSRFCRGCSSNEGS